MPALDGGALWEGLSQLFASEWVREAVTSADRQSRRERRLPAESVVRLVVAMGLFREQSAAELACKFDLARSVSGDGPLRSNAIAGARRRVGEAPLRALAERTAEAWALPSAAAHRWRGLAVLGGDGTTLNVADTPANREAFGVHRNQHGSSYPLLRWMVLMALRSRMIVAAVAAPYKGTAEVVLMEELLTKIPDHSLTVFDRGFLSMWLLSRVRDEGRERHWLTRAKSATRWRVVETYAPGDVLVEIKAPDEARRKHPSLPRTWRARALHYHRKGFRPQVLLTSLRDPVRWPAAEVVALYHERWELELGFDEIKTETLQREETLRSRTPDGVRQELWGLVVGYNLVRREIERTAARAAVPPTRISFVGVLRAVRERWVAAACERGAEVWRRMESGRAWLALFILPPRRSARQYPRAVKKTMSPYPRRKAATAEAPADAAPPAAAA
jgi:hypothetical protein